MLERVAKEADRPCLGVGSIAEFGCTRPELVKICHASGDGKPATTGKLLLIP